MSLKQITEDEEITRQSLGQTIIQDFIMNRQGLVMYKC